MNWRYQFYQPRLERSYLLTAYNRLYLLGQYGHNYFGITTLTENMTVDEWQYRWYLPKDTFVTDGASADFWGNHLFVARDQESMTFEVTNDGMLVKGSFNQRFPSKEGMLRLLCVGGRVYVFTAAGTIYWADVMESASIYDWNTMQSTLPKMRFTRMAVGYPVTWHTWFDVAKTQSGILYVHNYYQNRQHAIDIYHSVVPSISTFCEDRSKVKVAPLSQESTIKPESEIRLLTRDIADRRLIAWDYAQMRLIHSNDDGVNWQFFDSAYDKRGGPHYLVIEQFPDTHEWLAMSSRRLYRVSSDFKEWNRVTGGLPDFEVDLGYRMQELPFRKRVAISNADPKVVLVDIGDAIYKSVDGGHRWLRRDNGVNMQKVLGWSMAASGEVVFVPAGEQIAMSSTAWGVFVSDDAGESWSELVGWAKQNGWHIENAKLLQESRPAVCNLYPGDNGKIWLLLPGRWGRFIAGLVDFNNRTLRLSEYFVGDPQSSNSYWWESYTIAAENKFVVGFSNGVLVFRADGKQSTLKLIERSNSNKKEELNPFFCFASDTTNPNKIWAGTRGGVFYSDNGGNSWIKRR